MGQRSQSPLGWNRYSNKICCSERKKTKVKRISSFTTNFIFTLGGMYSNIIYIKATEKMYRMLEIINTLIVSSTCDIIVHWKNWSSTVWNFYFQDISIPWNKTKLYQKLDFPTFFYKTCKAFPCWGLIFPEINKLVSKDGQRG